MKLRQAVRDDVAAIAELWYRGWRDAHVGQVPDRLLAVRTRESFDARAAARLGDTAVAISDGELAGFAMVIGDELEQLYVAAGHRGSGVAAALLADAERRVAAAGHARAWLAVVPGNARARRFYERSGWRDDGPFDYAAASADGPIAVPCRRYVKAMAGA
ncbi:MAG TPA: GNAT family N-acetyltransferase [Kofleriaceae bacterium]|nr:GNAT family N-acetyltransferase [Kofleriaceae bacterium]